MKVAIAAALVMMGLLVAHAARRGTTAGASTPAGAVVSSRAPRADPKADDVVASAQANIEKGDFATAIDQLTTVERANPDRAEVHVGLEKAYTGVRNAREAMREAGLWLDAEPAGAADFKLQEDVRNAALFREAQEEAFQILESKMGARGIDILYDIAFGASGHLYPQAAARAKRSPPHRPGPRAREPRARGGAGSA